MRKILIFTLLLVATACSDQSVAPTQVPQQVQAFVKQNFPNKNISYAERDLEWFWYKYDVVLTDGTMISFDTDNVWDKIECGMNPVPAALVPAPVAAYVKTNFPAVAITKVDKEHYGYEVDLANGLELKFNKQGALMEMDD